MKHKRRYFRMLTAVGAACIFLTLTVICAAGIFLSWPQMRYLAGQASESLQSYYMSARAATVNQKGFTLFLNGSPLDTSDMWMSPQMHLMIPVGEARDYLGASVAVGEDGQCIVQGRYLENVVEISEERSSEAVMLDLTAVAETLGLSYQWDDSHRKASLETLQNSELPSRYDLRENRTLNVVENQGTFGTCWAFASTAALEIAQKGENLLDFSVDHMTMNSGFNISPTEGGDYNMALAYLASWKGPVLEADDPYGDGVTDTSLTAVKHLQEARFMDEKDLNKIKQMVLDYGAVESSLYMSIQNAWDSSEDYEPISASYYYDGEELPNHDIVIVGWDDYYSRENFNHMPEHDGAFICRNSWGEDFGDGGYFYVSYEDSQLGKDSVIYTRLDETDNYSSIYQSDLLGWVGTLGYKEPDGWFANVYTAEEDAVLSAVSFYAVDGKTSYDIYAVADYTGEEDLTEPVYLGSGYCENGGYYTVDIPSMVHLKAGRKFAVVVRISTEGSERPIAIEYAASELTEAVDLTDGEGYISYDGTGWASVEDEYQCNLCLKAFTNKEENLQ